MTKLTDSAFVCSFPSSLFPTSLCYVRKRHVRLLCSEPRTLEACYLKHHLKPFLFQTTTDLFTLPLVSNLAARVRRVMEVGRSDQVFPNGRGCPGRHDSRTTDTDCPADPIGLGNIGQNHTTGKGQRPQPTGYISSKHKHAHFFFFFAFSH